MAEQLIKPLIRQGWLRAISFFILYMLVISSVSVLSQKIPAYVVGANKSDSQNGMDQLSFLMGVFLMTIITLSIVWLFRKYVDKQTVYSLGFALKDNRVNAGIGFLAATAMLGIGTLILIITGSLNFTEWDGNVKYLAVNLLLMLLVAVMEEAVFRGYLLNNLMQSLNKWLALGVSAVLFTIIHLGNNGSDVLPMIEIFIAGIMLGINYVFTRNLWFGITLHFAWNFLQGPVLGYEVSGLKLPSLLKQEMIGPTWLTGGTFGFEGSVLAMGLNIALIVMLVRIYNRNPFSRQNT